MKKIAIDTSAISEKYGIRGAGFYAKRLIKAFQKINTGDCQISSFNFKEASKEKLSSYSLLHYPYFDPFFPTLPFRKVKPTIVTVHDLIPLKFPQYFPRGIRGEIKWQMQKLSLKSSAGIITDSKSSKKDIYKITGYNKEKIHVVYLAPDEEFKVLKKEKLPPIAKKFKLPQNYILYVGDLNWNKNLPGLINSFYGLKKTDYSLVIVGKAFLNKNLAERIALVKLIKKLNISSKVKFLGFIPTKDLTAVYNLAKVYCQPSFYEGFGLPVLEAMACGCPVVSSNASSLSEIAGEAALLVKPEVKEITKGLSKLIGSESLKNKLKEKGLRQASKFTWEKTARQTLKIYSSVISSSLSLRAEALSEKNNLGSIRHPEESESPRHPEESSTKDLLL